MACLGCTAKGRAPTALPRLCISVIFLSFLFLVYRIFFTRGGKLNLPPSPPRLPIIGNIHQLGKLPHRSLRALADKYGPVMLLHFCGNPIVVVSSAEAAEEVMKTHDLDMATRPRTTATNIFTYGFQDVAFAPNGEHWRRAKKISVHKLLSQKRVQSFQFVREEEAAVVIDEIRSECGEGAPINLSEMLTAFSINTVFRCVLGRKSEEGGDGRNFGQLARKLTQQLTAFSIGDMFRSLEWMDNLTGFIPQLKSTARAFDALLDQVIEEHRNSGTVDDKFAKEDFVDILLEFQKNESLGFPLSDDSVKAILMDMFVAGIETSSTAMEWSMAELVRNPNIMKKAQEEVRRIVGKKSKVESDDIDKMNYLECIIKETLRLHPPLPLTVPRETMASSKLGNYHIPAKITVIVNAFAVHTDPNIWDRPEEFLPERFENNTIDVQGGQDFQYIPFGGGRRYCPGMPFSLAQMTFLVVNLLHWFDWKLPDDRAPQDLDMSEVSGLTVTKKVPLHLVPALHSF